MRQSFASNSKLFLLPTLLAGLAILFAVNAPLTILLALDTSLTIVIIKAWSYSAFLWNVLHLDKFCGFPLFVCSLNRLPLLETLSIVE